jgi:hypothetical protein
MFRTKKLMTIHDKFTTPSSMPNYGLSNEAKIEIGKFYVLKLKFKLILVQKNGKLVLAVNINL